jgi:hypothetical protein
MISTNMRAYNYYLYADSDGYGQPQLSEEIAGTVKMAINIASQAVQDSILYNGAQYVGLTRDDITDKYVIQYGAERLKVLYINPNGRLKQIFMSRV